jgi:hypothetical protein
MIKFSVAVLLASLLTACGYGKEDPEGAVPAHMMDSMDKAENVEDVLQQAEQQRREQAEQ